jgi:uncharacterized protein involved in outer membrane biogenesis
VSSSVSPEQNRAAAWLAGRRDAWRAGLRETWADHQRRWRLIRVVGFWAALALVVAVFFALFDWDWFRGPVARWASARTGRPVQIQGHLDVHPFSLTPRATVGGLTVGNPKWMGGGQTANLGRTTVQVKLLPLLSGHVTLPLVDIEKPTISLYRDPSGRNNWTLGKGDSGPAKLPLIQHFILRDGALHIEDKQRKMVFDGSVTTSETLGGAGAGAFHLNGKGALNGAPFLAEITGGPLVHVQRDRPYPFDMNISSAYSHVTAKGTVTRPFDLGRLHAAVNLDGRDLADLYRLTGVVLPNTPAYRLAADVTRNGETFHLQRINGRVGRSDLHGALTIEKIKGRRFMKGDLASRSLDFTDLGAVFGGPQAGKAPAAEKAAAQAHKASTGRMLPDAPLDVQRVRTMDADVRYRAQSVRATGGLPLRQVGAHLTLDHGLLRLDPVALTFPRGQLRGRAQIDARGATPLSKVDFALTDLRLEDLMPRPQGVVPLEGVAEARAVLSGAGNTVHKAAASSNGRVTLALPAGRMRRAFAELMGVNVVPGLFQLLSKDPKETELRCAVADFQVRNGVMSVRRLVFDTGVVITDGSGTVNLGTERLDLTLKGHTKKPRIMRVIAPFHVQGSLAQPKFKIEAGPAVAQAGAAVGLGALLSPLAAIIPFIAPGGAKDADCAALLAEARSAGAPVKSAHIASAPPMKKGGLFHKR